MTTSHIPFFIFLYETKCGCVDKVSVFVKKIGFQKYEFVLAKRLSGGFLMWQSNIIIEVVLYTEFLINSLIFYDSYQDPWKLIFVYGPPIIHTNVSSGTILIVLEIHLVDHGA